jgi:hypothetical protein
MHFFCADLNAFDSNLCNINGEVLVNYVKFQESLEFLFTGLLLATILINK